jgi:AcrR family transcriptional regulator
MGRGDNKRERLINAAADLFWSRGYRATSLADIAHSADIPVGNIYYYFRTKRALADAVTGLFCSQTRDAIDIIEADIAAPVDRVLAFFELIASSNAARAEHGCPIANSVREAKIDPDSASGRASGEPLWMMIDWIAEQAKQAGLSEPYARAERAIAEWQGAIVLAQTRGEIGVLEQAFARIRRQFVTGFG